MNRWHRPYLWLALALVAILLVAAALWLHGTRSGTGGRSALPTPAILADSPLSTPTLATSHPTTWSAGGAVLLWVTLGIVLALGIALVILRWQGRDARYRNDTQYRDNTR